VNRGSRIVDRGSWTLSGTLPRSFVARRSSARTSWDYCAPKAANYRQTWKNRDQGPGTRDQGMNDLRDAVGVVWVEEA
jgi:hypothetical protein